MIKYYRPIVIFLFGAFCSAYSYSQHYQFSQFYSAPTYLNPAFTGANVCSRLSMTYRDQWPSIPGTFVSYQVSFDHSLQSVNSGIGLLFFTDKAGSGSLKTTQASLLYAYEYQIARHIMGRVGFSGGFVGRSIDYASLLFGDQIARGGASSSVEKINNGTSYMDFGTGALFYTNNAWFGFTFTHLTNPNQAIMHEAVADLPREFKMHGGYKFSLSENKDNQKTQKGNSFLTVAFNYKKQLEFDQTDAGFYYTKSPITFGLWYRGIPLLKAYKKGYQNNDAVVFLAGISIDRLNVGYSYDLTISQLAPHSGGSHEVSIKYQFCELKKVRRKPIVIYCPKF